MKRQFKIIANAILVFVLIVSVSPPIPVLATPGNVTISGHITYQPRNWNPAIQNYLNGNELFIGTF